MEKQPIIKNFSLKIFYFCTYKKNVWIGLLNAKVSWWYIPVKLQIWIVVGKDLIHQIRVSINEIKVQIIECEVVYVTLTENLYITSKILNP